MTNNYIEFRVYLKERLDSLDMEYVIAAAADLQDIITDSLEEEEAPNQFTQDVTYEIKAETNV